MIGSADFFNFSIKLGANNYLPGIDQFLKIKGIIFKYSVLISFIFLNSHQLYLEIYSIKFFIFCAKGLKKVISFLSDNPVKINISLITSKIASCCSTLDVGNLNSF